MSRQTCPRPAILAAVAVLGSLAAARPSAAQVHPVGPFKGSWSEGFEHLWNSQIDFPGMCLDGRVFQDNGDFCNADGNKGVQLATMWGGTCYITPHKKKWMGFSLNSAVAVSFDQGATRFGTYLSTVYGPGTSVVTFRFLDAGGALLDTQPVEISSDCEWQWVGWQTDGGPFARVEIEHDKAAGGWLLFDDMEFVRPGQDATLGQSYCGPATLNSSGKSAYIEATGSAELFDKLFVLNAAQMPANQFGYFLVADMKGFVPFAGGSQGHLCLSGNIARWSHDVLHTGDLGTFWMRVKLVSLPFTPPIAVQPGDTWHFQAWFRDVNPIPTSNFTDGVEVTFF